MINPKLLKAASKAIAPPQRLLPSEWAVQNFRLSPEASAEPGNYHWNRAPYQREMLDAIAHPDTKEVVVMASAQTGKSTIELILVGYLIDLAPCPMLWVAPTLEMAEATSKDRLAPMFRDSPCFKGKIKDPRSRDSGNTLLHKSYPGGQLVLAGANSPASLASRPIQVVLVDEADRFPLSAGTEGDPIALAKKRTTTFWNRMVITVSTPTVKGVSRIEKAWAGSDQRRFYVPCPHCGFEQSLSWDNLRYQGKGELDRPSNIPDVMYFCGACGAGIEEHHKAEMLAAGYWQAGRESGGIVGFHLNELYSPWKSWHDVALDFEAAKSDPMQFQVWVNTSLGEPFEPDTRTRYDWENLLYRSEESDYSQGSVPAGVLFMTAGVDVQGDRLEVGIFGWGEGEECWLIGHYQVYGVPTDSAVWEKTEGLLNAQFDHPLGGKISVSRVFVDTGFETHEVYGQVRMRRNWFAVKGVAGDRPIVGKPSLQEVNWRGERIKKGIKLYTVGIDKVKEVLLSRCRIDKPGPKYLHLPQDAGRFWCQGFAGSEVRMQKHRNGHPYYVWETVQGVRNEPLDCAVYAFAAAIQAGINRPNFFKGRREVLTVEKGVKAEVMEVQAEVKAPEKAKKRQRRGSYLNGFGGR